MNNGRMTVGICSNSTVRAIVEASIVVIALRVAKLNLLKCQRATSGGQRWPTVASSCQWWLVPAGPWPVELLLPLPICSKMETSCADCGWT